MRYIYTIVYLTFIPTLQFIATRIYHHAGTSTCVSLARTHTITHTQTRALTVSAYVARCTCGCCNMLRHAVDCWAWWLLLRLPLAAHKTCPSLTLLFSVKAAAVALPRAASLVCSALPCLLLLPRARCPCCSWLLLCAHYHFAEQFVNNKNTTLFDREHTHTQTYTHILNTYTTDTPHSFGWHFKHFATHICNTFWWPFSNSFASIFPSSSPSVLKLFPRPQLLLEIRFFLPSSPHNFSKTLLPLSAFQQKLPFFLLLRLALFSILAGRKCCQLL